MPLARPTRTAHALVGALLAGTVLTACSGETAADPEPTDGVATTEEPSPAAEVVAPLLERDEVDVATLDLPDAPDGVSPEAWASNAESVRAIAVASLDPELWSTPPGPDVVTPVANEAPSPITRSMKELDSATEPALSLYFGPTFEADVQPSEARVVDARWTSDVSMQGQTSVDRAVLETTTVYTFDEQTPIVVRHAIRLGSQNPANEPLGVFRWGLNIDASGHDACVRWTDGLLTPAASPDLDELQDLVDHVVDAEPIGPEGDLIDDVAAEREKACSDGA